MTENRFLIIALLVLFALLFMLSIPFLPCERYETHQVFVVAKPPAHSHYTTKEFCVKRILPLPF
jgi:hypothetical protein